MITRSLDCPRRPLRRAGFTLVEVMVVLLIILLLVGMILPAINGVMRRMTFVRERAELTQIETALERFKERYGSYPPSRIRLRESTSYSTADQFDQHSVQWLRKIWPQIELTESVASTALASQAFVWFADNPTTETIGGTAGNGTTYELEGDECLVFFLGGIAQLTDPASPATSSIVLHGFAKRSNNPSGIPLATDPTSLNRETFYDEFNQDRLFVRSGASVAPPVGGVLAGISTGFNGHDFGLPTGGVRPTKLPSYRALSSTNPSNPKPYAYFSSYEGYGYRPHDCDIPDAFKTEQTCGYFAMIWTIPSTGVASTGVVAGAGTSAPTSVDQAALSLGPNPYLQSDPFVDTDGNLFSNPSPSLAKAFNQKTYQLISPGVDDAYGPGGMLKFTENQSQSYGYDNLSNVSGEKTVGAFAADQK